MKRIKFICDKSNFIFPIAFRWTGVGNNNRTWTVSLDFLWFSLIFCIDEDSY